MNVVIAGGSGFLGGALKRHLIERGDSVKLLTRTPTQPDHIAWAPDDDRGTWVDAVASADAVVNLAGEPVDRGRWTAARKHALLDSRITATRGVVRALQRLRREGVLLNASGVGYYGTHGDEVLTEESPPGADFLAHICRQWESEAMKAAAFRRVVRLRTGLVLDANRGALARMITPFRFGLGGTMGSGRQYWSWIHCDDWVRLVMFAMSDRRLEGPVNLVAPNPVTNREFTATLAEVLHRPAVVPAPAFAMKLALGEMADAMVLGGQRIGPTRALQYGFEFRFSQLGAALRALLPNG